MRITEYDPCSQVYLYHQDLSNCLHWLVRVAFKAVRESVQQVAEVEQQRHSHQGQQQQCSLC
jgi:hypothetical protein